MVWVVLVHTISTLMRDPPKRECTILFWCQKGSYCQTLVPSSNLQVSSDFGATSQRSRGCTADSSRVTVV